MRHSGPQLVAETLPGARPTCQPVTQSQEDFLRAVAFPPLLPAIFFWAVVPPLYLPGAVVPGTDTVLTDEISTSLGNDARAGRGMRAPPQRLRGFTSHVRPGLRLV